MDLLERYPRLIVAASYGVLVFGAVALGMRIEAAAAGGGAGWFPIAINLTTIVLAVFALHYGYTVGWYRHVHPGSEQAETVE